MFWADQLARSVSGKQIVHDAKTPSGRVHVGALRGVVIHDVIYKTLKDHSIKAEFYYGDDDYDPMDSLPSYLDEAKWKQYMGMPLSEIPSPDGSGSYADYFMNEFITAYEKLDAKPKIYKTSELYKTGKFNDAIKAILSNAEKIRGIYKKVSGSEKKEGWLPFNVVCEKCGKIGTTHVYEFNGETVKYKCEPEMVKWAKGCGHSGETSPYNGNGKLPWKVEWPSVWSIMGVTIEGAGKDHSTPGGARDIADAVLKEVFQLNPPLEVPYEWFLVGGKKMSSSKGVGVSAKEVSELIPPELLRFLMARYKPQTAINFSPDGDYIPKLFDDFDSFAKAFYHPENLRDPDMPRIYELSRIKETSEAYLPQFSLVAFVLQVPSVNEEEFFEQQKGSALTQEEKEILKERIHYAKIWLDKFADEDSKLKQLSLEESKKEFDSLSEAQQNALREFSNQLGLSDFDQQGKAKEISLSNGLKIQEFFAASYKVLIGKERGPKLMPLMRALGKEFVSKRFNPSNF